MSSGGNDGDETFCERTARTDRSQMQCESNTTNGKVASMPATSSLAKKAATDTITERNSQAQIASIDSNFNCIRDTVPRPCQRHQSQQYDAEQGSLISSLESSLRISPQDSPENSFDGSSTPTLYPNSNHDPNSENHVTTDFQMESSNTIEYLEKSVFSGDCSTAYIIANNADLMARIYQQYPSTRRPESFLENLYATNMIAESLSRHTKEPCSCDAYKAKREIFGEELEMAMKFHCFWLEFRQSLRVIFDAALEAPHILDAAEPENTNEVPNLWETRNIALFLCKIDSHQLFTRLVSQAQKFVIETKVRLLHLLQQRDGNNLVQNFLAGLLNDYDALISTACHISKLVKPLKKRLCKSNFTWDCFVRKLYQIYVYNDPLVQNKLPSFILQLRNLLPLKGSEYQTLVRRYLAFDDEMIKIGFLWPETEPWMNKYNAAQAVRLARFKKIRNAWEVCRVIRLLTEERSLTKSRESAKSSTSSKTFDEKSEASESDCRSPNSTPKFCLDGLDMPPITSETVQILLDGWNKTQCQPTTDDMNVSDEINSSSSLPQFALESLGGHAEEISLENSVDDGKTCECHTCASSSLETSLTIDGENILPFDPSKFPFLSNAFTDEMSARSVGSQTRITLEEQEELITQSIDVDNTAELITEDVRLKNVESQPCACVYGHAREIAEWRKEVLEYPPCPCLLNFERKWDACPCLMKDPPESSVPPIRNTAQSPKSPPNTPVSNAVSETVPEATTSAPLKIDVTTQSAQTQTTRSITQTTSTATRESSTHRQVNSMDGDCSDSASSQEDSCSTTSSVQKDQSRHCDCCYCEVFGHGVPSVAPVSRNYNEMRERLRQLLTKKKARKCKTPSSPPKNESTTTSVNGTVAIKSSPTMRIKTEPCQVAQPPSTATVHTTPTVIATNTAPKTQRDEWDLDELLEFIEGNQTGKKENNKKAEKKARQKQRKLEEKLRLDRQEAERLKLVELQKKTPEVTITVVDPQKPVPQRLLPQCNLPEVSILPTVSPTVLLTAKQSNNKKRDKQELCNIGNSANTSTGINTRGTVITSSIHSSSNVNNISSNINNSHNKNSDNSNGNGKAKVIAVNSNAKEKVSNSNKNDKTGCGSPNTIKSSTKVEKTETFGNRNNKAQNPTSDSSIKVTQNTAVDKVLPADLMDKQLTKKERKKLRREMRKMEEARANELAKSKPAETQPQIVTIKRVMESNSAEPTVTITLKGQSPAEDKVLFTLVNGQTKEPPPQHTENEQNLTASQKKKKSKANANSLQQGNKAQQTNSAKQPQQQSVQVKLSNNKNLKAQTNNEKCKCDKGGAEKKQPQQQTTIELKTSKSKKDKKHLENKENVLQHENPPNKNKTQQQKVLNKKQIQKSISPANSVGQKQQQQQQQQQKLQQSPIANESSSKKNKVNQQQEKNNQNNSQKNDKSTKNDTNQKGQKKVNPTQLIPATINVSTLSANITTSTSTNKLHLSNQDLNSSAYTSDRVTSSLSSQFKDISTNSKINIENLKLPPGITITKVDAPAKPLPIRSAPMPKPVNPPKQTTIIAAPMSGVQSSYATPQAGGNVIVVDTGKLKQDLLPRPMEKDSTKDMNQIRGNCGNRNPTGNNDNINGSSTGSKKKKKKNKNSNSNNSTNNGSAHNIEKCMNEQSDEPARILHNPGTNMVTIRNPAFGPMKVAPTQQAAIIKVSENGMVTIRSPALQHAINAGLTAPPKPDYIVKGELSSLSTLSPTLSRPSETSSFNTNSKMNSNATVLSSTNAKLSTKSNGVITSHLAELPSRLQSSDCTSLSGLANIHISKVTNGQIIPENGINLKGTSVTLTKVRTETCAEQVQSAKTAMREALNASIATSSTSSSPLSSNGKSKKKKKRGNGTRQGGDDWNLVESVFTPKDIDLEDGEMDDAERELEAFKRFCLQSVPPPRKEKVNLNIKDIVLKKKSSSSNSSSPPAATVITAN